MMSVSLDGYIEGPNREIDWHLVDDELHYLAGFWPTADTAPASTPPMVDFARIWREMPKIVYSKTFQRARWMRSRASRPIQAGTSPWAVPISPRNSCATT